MINRKERIKEKGFKMTFAKSSDNDIATDFAKVRLGAKMLEDATIKLGDLRRVDNRSLADKENVMRAIRDGNVPKMMEISDFFFNLDGIYSRLCRYLAYLYRYDWYVTPHFDNQDNLSEAAITKGKKDFYKVLSVLDDFHVQQFCGDVALKVITQGAYYGFLTRLNNNKFVIQELPAAFCRSRFEINGRPVVEMHMSYFTKLYADADTREKMMKMWPKDIQKGYRKYLNKELPPILKTDTPGWYVLDPESTIKFNMNNRDYPMMISVIPALIDLNDAQGLDKKRLEQKLLKIIIQQMPIDKNGDLVFDVDEAQALHNNAVQMLSRAIGVDVLTTFADVDVADMSTSTDTATDDGMNRIRSTVYDQAGVSSLMFNSDGNIALEKSQLNDEAAMRTLLAQFEAFLNLMIEPYNKKSEYFVVELLETTIYNYKDLSKMYKEQTQIGYSKMLPAIALGESQSSILATAFFENNILELYNVFIPPISTNTLSSDTLVTLQDQKSARNKGQTTTTTNDTSSESSAGRPTKESQGETVSDKTLANRESQS